MIPRGDGGEGGVDQVSPIVDGEQSDEVESSDKDNGWIQIRMGVEVY